MNYLIRNAVARDVPSIALLARGASTAAQWTEQQYEDLITNDESIAARLFLVASLDENGPIVGFLVARQAAGECELENIVVAGENRGKGIGTSLLGELLARAQASDGDSIFLEVRESNSPARRLYSKLGFEENGRRKGYYSNPVEDAILYSKTLQKESSSG